MVDLGSSYDVTVVTVDNGVLEIIDADGDFEFGGSDFDSAPIKYLVKYNIWFLNLTC